MSAFAIYCRVSTAKQGASGLGMDAQKQMCINYIQSRNGVVDAEPFFMHYPAFGKPCDVILCECVIL